MWSFEDRTHNGNRSLDDLVEHMDKGPLVRRGCSPGRGRVPVPINNPQQSWGFKGEPPKAVMKDSGTRDWTSLGFELQLQLIQLLICHFLVLDVGADRLLVPPDR